MTIQRQEIEKLATLSRLSIDDKTIAEVTERLSSVLSLVDQLQTADTSSVTNLERPFHNAQRLREDQVSESSQRESFQAIAPDTHNELFSVPKMIE
ncbi:MAG: Asp-tRNA(Asn)/Glu-tRNA(Gln) amidotransferase subunit GatC [Porticoccaceae bacterium]|nr:Asp-tRNA(Asn)/Glu-tRNA(Gln) amidotransferase subunit GatC [Porticoccaceae bacterium]MDG1473989.1 Asp-tRNA(Asn)/Glu-tRNA(Gln) amidotransferase subunit GatC [Porticoccaceae bacterium]